MEAPAAQTAYEKVPDNEVQSDTAQLRHRTQSEVARRDAETADEDMASLLEMLSIGDAAPVESPLLSSRTDSNGSLLGNTLDRISRKPKRSASGAAQLRARVKPVEEIFNAFGYERAKLANAKPAPPATASAGLLSTFNPLGSGWNPLSPRQPAELPPDIDHSAYVTIQEVVLALKMAMEADDDKIKVAVNKCYAHDARYSGVDAFQTLLDQTNEDTRVTKAEFEKIIVECLNAVLERKLLREGVFKKIPIFKDAKRSARVATTFHSMLILQKHYVSADQNRSGTIEMPELKLICERFKMRNMSEPRCAELWSILDVDGSGYVSWIELLDGLQRARSGGFEDFNSDRLHTLKELYDPVGIHHQKQAEGLWHNDTKGLEKWAVGFVIREYRRAQDLHEGQRMLVTNTWASIVKEYEAQLAGSRSGSKKVQLKYSDPGATKHSQRRFVNNIYTDPKENVSCLLEHRMLKIIRRAMDNPQHDPLATVAPPSMGKLVKWTAKMQKQGRKHLQKEGLLTNKKRTSRRSDSNTDPDTTGCCSKGGRIRSMTSKIIEYSSMSGSVADDFIDDDDGDDDDDDDGGPTSNDGAIEEESHHKLNSRSTRKLQFLIYGFMLRAMMIGIASAMLTGFAESTATQWFGSSDNRSKLDLNLAFDLLRGDNVPHDIHEHIGFFSMILAATAIATVGELWYITWDSLRTCTRVGNLTGIVLEPLNQDRADMAKYITRSAMDISNPMKEMMGVNSQREVRWIWIILQGVLHKVKKAATSFVAKTVIKKFGTRTGTKTVLPFVSAPVNGLFGTAVAFKTCHNAYVITLGIPTVIEVAEAALAMFPDIMDENEFIFKLACCKAVSCCIVSNQDLDPVILKLLKHLVLTTIGEQRGEDPRIDLADVDGGFKVEYTSEQMQGFLEKYGITEDSNMLARGLPCFLKDHATGNEVEAEIVSRKSVLKSVKGVYPYELDTTILVRKMTQPLTFEEVEVPLDKTKPHPIQYRDLDLLELVELCSPQQQMITLTMLLLAITVDANVTKRNRLYITKIVEKLRILQEERYRMLDSAYLDMNKMNVGDVILPQDDEKEARRSQHKSMHWLACKTRCPRKSIHEWFRQRHRMELEVVSQRNLARPGEETKDIPDPRAVQNFPVNMEKEYLAPNNLMLNFFATPEQVCANTTLLARRFKKINVGAGYIDIEDLLNCAQGKLNKPMSCGMSVGEYADCTFRFCAC